MEKNNWFCTACGLMWNAAEKKNCSDCGEESQPFNESALTVENFRDFRNKMPRPVGYALLKGSAHVSGEKSHKILNETAGAHLYILFVSNEFLDIAVMSLRATPYGGDGFPGAYEFPVFSLLQDDVD